MRRIRRINIKPPSPRAIRYWSNILMILVSGLFLIWKGPILFVNSEDPNLFRYLLYGSVIILVPLFVWMTYKSRRNTLFSAIIRPILLSLVSLFGTFTTGNLLLTTPGIGLPETRIFDQNITELIELSQMLRDEDNLDGAESLLVECLSIADVPVEKNACEINLARIYVEQVSQIVDHDICREEYSINRLGKALGYAEKNEEIDLISLVNDKFHDLERVCQVIIEIPDISNIFQDTYEFDILRAEDINRFARIDFRVFKNGVQLMNLGANNFEIYRETNLIDNFSFTTRNADDPVCIIAVVDNSGSIYEGLSKIHDAINILNELRKPKDELGLVIFGNPTAVQVAQEPSRKSIDSSNIDGSNRLTALWMGTELGIDTASRCEAEDRYLLVLTDGTNTANYPLDDNEAARTLSRKAKENRINICTVGIRSEDLNEAPLYILATGCDYFEANRLDDDGDVDVLASKFREIIGFVRDFYRIEFPSSELVGGEEYYLQVITGGEFKEEKNVEFDS